MASRPSALLEAAPGAPRAARVAALNDAFRRTFISGQVVETVGVRALGERDRIKQFTLTLALLGVVTLIIDGAVAQEGKKEGRGQRMSLKPATARAAVFDHHSARDALWAKFFTEAPARQRQSVARYSYVKNA